MEQTGQSSNRVFQTREDLEQFHRTASSKTDKPVIALCEGTGCRAGGCLAVASELERQLAQQGLGDQVDVLYTGCHGFCEQGPIVVFRLPEAQRAEDSQGRLHGNVFYPHVKPKHVSELLQATIQEHKIVEKRLYRDPKSGEALIEEGDIPFYKHQERLIFGQNGHIDPTRIEDYLAQGGYRALAKALFEMDPDRVITQVIESGLRGRGGGGFPTGRKWKEARQAPGDIKYVMCNADEGDPGAFMDRSILEGNPHLVLEGMVIGSYAIGAHQGYIYVRDEYPLAVENATRAIEQARAHGLLGENILGSGHSFDITVVRGGGAFVCGESTALMASIEGRIGEPRAKYVHTVKEGLWNRPSNLNNVETWANVPLIIEKGPQALASIGTKGSKGTKIFSLVGKVQSTGLVEVPMGMTLRQIVEDIGGGVATGDVKAVQTGGPSGGCIPAEKLDLPVDFDALTSVGSMMGSGGLIVMDQSTCMVDVARYFVDFLKGESCGKCTPCRSGLAAMHEILERICDGEGKMEDLDFLEELGEWMSRGSLCALGTSAPNPVLSTLRFFRHEYEAHIKEKRCPAGVCSALITYRVVAENCTGCALCVKACPTGALQGKVKEVPTLDTDLCIKCGACMDACRFDAIARG